MNKKQQTLLSTTPAVKKKMADLNERIWNLKSEIDSLAEPHLPMSPMFYRYDFDWGCRKSPFGWCAYDHYKDRSHDNCVFCHGPQERK